MTTHHRNLILVGGVIAVILVLLFGPGLALRRSTVQGFLEDYFAGEVHLESFDVALWPGPNASATGVVLRRQGAGSEPPIVTIDRVRIDAGIFGLLRSPRHLRRVRLEGLTIRIPPEGSVKRDQSRERGDKETPLVVDLVVSERARLEILPDEAGKKPLTFELRQLTARSIALDRPLTFECELINPKPRGVINTSGEFGPWNKDDAGLTPVSGRFTYEDVDMNTIGGIGGTLSAKGTFEGPLRRIGVEGTTSMPDFTVDVAGHPIPMDTTFDAHVDGTNGDTYLEPVEARFFDTTLIAKGKVVDQPEPDGREVVLDVTIDKGRIEDVLRFALKAEPPLAGDLRLKTSFRLPAEDRKVTEKLELDGTFAVDRATFTSGAVQSKIEGLSERAQGTPGSEAEANLATNFEGRFRLKDGVLTLRGLTFEVPGAHVSLAGTYTLASEALDMRGTLRMDAKVSETTTGWKSALLKIVDPLFSKGRKGSVVPIRLKGTARQPDFGLDVGRTIKGK